MYWEVSTLFLVGYATPTRVTSLPDFISCCSSQGRDSCQIFSMLDIPEAPGNHQRASHLASFNSSHILLQRQKTRTERHRFVCDPGLFSGTSLKIRVKVMQCELSTTRLVTYLLLGCLLLTLTSVTSIKTCDNCLIAKINWKGNLFKQLGTNLSLRPLISLN